ncbi:MarR family winged helix-turn-helix transcriptional regulator [Streptomyces sp. NPDC047070]|uniref:MarR family winged helix-turn-helix transcriptional regulator n=1 Tax=Streptomyces sp. NPDC047070 TaxID=3154923 RepID=UPI00345111AA
MTTSRGPSLITRWNALDRLHGRIENSVERRLHEDFGLSLREFQALTVLQEGTATAHGWLYLQDLAAEIGLSQSATSRLVTRLESRALITTSTAAHDRRSVDVSLTPVARETLRRGRRLVDETVRHAVQALVDGGINEGADHDLLRYLREGSSGGMARGALPHHSDVPPGPPGPAASTDPAGHMGHAREGTQVTPSDD